MQALQATVLDDRDDVFVVVEIQERESR